MEVACLASCLVLKFWNDALLRRNVGYTCVERSQQRVGRTDWKIQAPSFYFFRKIVVLSWRILLASHVQSRCYTLYGDSPLWWECQPSSGQWWRPRGGGIEHFCWSCLLDWLSEHVRSKWNTEVSQDSKDNQLHHRAFNLIVNFTVCWISVLLWWTPCPFEIGSTNISTSPNNIFYLFVTF